MGDVGHKFETKVPDLDARGSFTLLILDQLSRKFDGSALSARYAEAFSDLLKLFHRGRAGVYLFRMHMQAPAPIP